MAMAPEKQVGRAGADGRSALAQGQSVWLDYITRDLVRKGELRTMIEEDGLRGMTSNPTIFQKAISRGGRLRRADRRTDARGEAMRDGVFEAAGDQGYPGRLRSLPRRSTTAPNGGDGFVSIEVSPRLARDTEGTIEEARRLWAAVERPNVMIKVPGTAEGAPAVATTLLRRGSTLMSPSSSRWRITSG